MANIVSIVCFFLNTYQVFGTPWKGSGKIAENDSVLLDKSFFIHHGQENKINKLSPKEVLLKIFPVSSIPFYDEILYKKAAEIFEDLIDHSSFYDLYFKPSPKIVYDLERFLDE